RRPGGWQRLPVATRQMVEVQWIALHVVAGRQVIESLNSAVDLGEAPVGGDSLHPSREQDVPALLLEGGLVFVPDEPEHELDARGIPGWRGPNPDLTQSAQSPTLVALLVVLGRHPVHQRRREGNEVVGERDACSLASEGER